MRNEFGMNFLEHAMGKNIPYGEKLNNKPLIQI